MKGKKHTPEQIIANPQSQVCPATFEKLFATKKALRSKTPRMPHPVPQKLKVLWVLSLHKSLKADRERTRYQFNFFVPFNVSVSDLASNSPVSQLIVGVQGGDRNPLIVHGSFERELLDKTCPSCGSFALLGQLLPALRIQQVLDD